MKIRTSTILPAKTVIKKETMLVSTQNLYKIWKKN